MCVALGKVFGVRLTSLPLPGLGVRIMSVSNISEKGIVNHKPLFFVRRPVYRLKKFRSLKHMESHYCKFAEQPNTV